MYKQKLSYVFFVFLTFIFSISTFDFNAIAQDEDIIFIGSKSFPEGEILSWIIYLALENAGYRVIELIPTGRTAEVRQALLNGEIDVYVEYTGTGIFLLYEQFPNEIDLNNAFDPAKAIASLSAFDASFNDLIWLTPGPANNTYGLAITEEFSIENNIRTLVDLAVYINAGNPVVVAGENEFFNRDDGLPSFMNKYGFALTPEQLYSIPNAQPKETLAALTEGINGTNIAMAYGTTAELLIGRLLLLEDTLAAQPVYQPAPVFRGETIRNNPEIASILRPIFLQLDNLALRELNAAVTVFNDDPRNAALNFLKKIGVIPDERNVVLCQVTRPVNSTESANLRSEPRIDSVRVGSLAGGAAVTANGKYEAPDGIWYRLVLDAWVRSDTVQASSECDRLLFVEP